MATIDPQTLGSAERFRLLTGSIVPRPIAWVTTTSVSGLVNLAPFSYFMGVTSSPLTLAISIGARSPIKDTLANLRDRGEAVVHLVPASQAEAVNQTGAEYRSDVSEVEQLSLMTVDSERVSPPRLSVADVALECILHKEVHVGSPGATICILEVVLAHVRDRIAGRDGLPHPRKLRAVARLGERFYLDGSFWEIFDQPRPLPPEGLGRDQ